MIRSMKRPLLLLLSPEGRVVEASETLEGSEGRECAEVVGARTLDGEPVCANGCRARDMPRGLPVKALGAILRLTCLTTPSGFAVWLEPTESATPLTSRERDVLQHVAQGRTTEQIARRLGIRPATVRTHVEHARDKLGCRTRAEAVLRAWKSGQLE